MWDRARMDRCGLLAQQDQTPNCGEEELPLQAHRLMLDAQEPVFLRSLRILKRHGAEDYRRAERKFAQKLKLLGKLSVGQRECRAMLQSSPGTSSGLETSCFGL